MQCLTFYVANITTRTSENNKYDVTMFTCLCTQYETIPGVTHTVYGILHQMCYHVRGCVMYILKIQLYSLLRKHRLQGDMCIHVLISVPQSVL